MPDNGLIRAGEPGFEEARQPWNLIADQRPAAIALPRSASDVAAAIKVARQEGLRVAAQSTGHAASRLPSLAGTVLVRTGGLRGIEVDAERRVARLGAGVTWGPAGAAAGQHGLAGLAGSSPTVGVVGYCLGGGIGWLSRLHGLAANSVRAIELVTGDGELRRADAESEPDLFWALRGGGGERFGVVTALEVDLFPLREVYAGTLTWPAEIAPDLLRAYIEWTGRGDVPREMTAFFRYLNLPPLPMIPEPLRGRAVVDVTACFCGGAAECEELLRPFRDAAGCEPLASTFAPMPAAGLARLNGDPEDPMPALTDGGLLTHLDEAAVDHLDSLLGPGSDSPLTFFQLRHLGGALAVAPQGAGALASLPGLYTFSAGAAIFDPAATAPVNERLGQLKEALVPYAESQRFLNFVDSPCDADACFPPSVHARLTEIAERFDPDGLFLTMTGF